jgi:hypothetical protein
MTPRSVILEFSALAMLLIAGLSWALVSLQDKCLALRNSKLRIKQLEENYSKLVLEYFNEHTGPLFENAPDWTSEDAAVLSGFFKTPTGQTLTKRFQVVAGNAAVEGCKDEMHTTYAAANANGWNEACQWFLKLSRVTGAQVATKDEQAPEGEAQLLERFSP